MSFKLSDLPPHLQDVARQQMGEAKPPAKQSKYRNVPTVIDGVRFDSRREGKYYVRLCMMKRAGELLWFCRQPRFLLPGGIEYRADFIVAYVDRVEVVDVKGTRTKEYNIKRRQMREVLGIEIVEV